MKKIISFLVKIIALLLVILLLVTFWSEISGFLRNVLTNTGKNVLETSQISHELKEVGILISRQYTDSGILVSTLPALIIKEAQRVTIPYEYTIDYGVDLEQASIRAVDEGLLMVSLPPAQMIHDALRVTGEVEVVDFLYPLTEARYQQILDEQTETLRQAYLDDPTHAQAALETAQDKVRGLLESMLDAQGAGDIWSVVFEETLAEAVA